MSAYDGAEPEPEKKLGLEALLLLAALFVISLELMVKMDRQKPEGSGEFGRSFTAIAAEAERMARSGAFGREELTLNAGRMCRNAGIEERLIESRISKAYKLARALRSGDMQED